MSSMAASPDLSARPFVTILMPIRNEAETITRSLGAVLSQDYPPDRLETLVIDGMSSDETRAIIDATARQHPESLVRVLDNPGRTASTALNIGLRQARGDVIIRVDGHCEIAPDYVRRCVAHLVEEGVEAVGGAIHTLSSGWVGETIAAAMSSHFGVGDSAFRTLKDHSRLVDTVPFPAYARRAVTMAGEFDEELVRNQDDEYNYRLRRLGGRILLAADVHSRYTSRPSLLSLWRQYFQYGLWKVRVFQKHPHQMSIRQFVPAALVAWIVAGGLASLFSTPLGWLWLAGVAIYALTNLVASLLAASRSGWNHLPLLPAAFAALHLSYGAGFWWGVFKFRHRWREHETGR
jgi:glycosyltransferase involved in cell wall biosynthesis